MVNHRGQKNVSAAEWIRQQRNNNIIINDANRNDNDKHFSPTVKPELYYKIRDFTVSMIMLRASTISLLPLLSQVHRKYLKKTQAGLKGD